MQKDHNSIYDLIAYVSLIIAWCLSIVLILFLVNIIEVADKNTMNILSIVIVGLSMIYHKLNPSIPITEAISKWWEKRKNSPKNQKVENGEIKTYQEYKNRESKK